MSLFNRSQIKEYAPFAAAFLIALIVLIYYIFSGQGSSNVSIRNLQNSDPKVESVKIQDEAAGQKNASIKCKDGSTYDIYYPPGETNFAAVAASKCPQD
jgi:hypothetical protein